MNNKRIIKYVSIFLVFAFFSEQLALAAPGQVLGEAGISSSTVSQNNVGLKFGIPESIAVVDDSYLAEGSDKTIILIQDAHTNTSAQLNIARVLDIILSKQSITNIFLEAGEGDMSLSDLRSAPLAKRKQVGLKYLKKGILQGSEYFDLTTEHNFKLWGVEDSELYDQGIQIYKNVVDQREEFKTYLAKLKSVSEFLKSKIYNPMLFEYDAIKSDYDKENLSITTYLNKLFNLTQSYNLTISTYPNINKLTRLQKNESQINFEQVNIDFANLLDTLSEEQRIEMGLTDSHMDLNVMNRGISSDSMHSLLSQVNVDAYGELKKYFRYLKRFKQFDIKKVMSELEALDSEVLYALARTQDEQSLWLLSDNLKLLTNLIDFKIQSEDYARIIVRKEVFDITKIAGFMNQKILELGSHQEKVLFIKNDFKDIIQAAESFYELTLSRDAAFIQNTLVKMDGDESRQSILITGGYHTPNIKKQLRVKNISYISITPTVTHETNHHLYENLLLSQKNNHNTKSSALGAMSLRLAAMPNSILSKQQLSQEINTPQVIDSRARFADDRGSLSRQGEQRAKQFKKKFFWDYFKDVAKEYRRIKHLTGYMLFLPAVSMLLGFSEFLLVTKSGWPNVLGIGLKDSGKIEAWMRFSKRSASDALKLLDEKRETPTDFAISLAIEFLKPIEGLIETLNFKNPYVIYSLLNKFRQYTHYSFSWDVDPKRVDSIFIKQLSDHARGILDFVESYEVDLDMQTTLFVDAEQKSRMSQPVQEFDDGKTFAKGTREFTFDGELGELNMAYWNLLHKNDRKNILILLSQNAANEENKRSYVYELIHPFKWNRIMITEIQIKGFYVNQTQSPQSHSGRGAVNQTLFGPGNPDPEGGLFRKGAKAEHEIATEFYRDFSPIPGIFMKMPLGWGTFTQIEIQNEALAFVLMGVPGFMTRRMKVEDILDKKVYDGIYMTGIGLSRLHNEGYGHGFYHPGNMSYNLPGTKSETVNVALAGIHDLDSAFKLEHKSKEYDVPIERIALLDLFYVYARLYQFAVEQNRLWADEEDLIALNELMTSFMTGYFKALGGVGLIEHVSNSLFGVFADFYEFLYEQGTVDENGEPITVGYLELFNQYLAIAGESEDLETTELAINAILRSRMTRSELKTVEANDLEIDLTPLAEHLDGRGVLSLLASRLSDYVVEQYLDGIKKGIEAEPHDVELSRRYVRLLANESISITTQVINKLVTAEFDDEGKKLLHTLTLIELLDAIWNRGSIKAKLIKVEEMNVITSKAISILENMTSTTGESNKVRVGLMKLLNIWSIWDIELALKTRSVNLAKAYATSSQLSDSEDAALHRELALVSVEYLESSLPGFTWFSEAYASLDIKAESDNYKRALLATRWTRGYKEDPIVTNVESLITPFLDNLGRIPGNDEGMLNAYTQTVSALMAVYDVTVNVELKNTIKATILESLANLQVLSLDTLSQAELLNRLTLQNHIRSLGWDNTTLMASLAKMNAMQKWPNIGILTLIKALQIIPGVEASQATMLASGLLDVLSEVSFKQGSISIHQAIIDRLKLINGLYGEEAKLAYAEIFERFLREFNQSDADVSYDNQAALFKLFESLFGLVLESDSSQYSILIRLWNQPNLKLKSQRVIAHLLDTLVIQKHYSDSVLISKVARDAGLQMSQKSNESLDIEQINRIHWFFQSFSQHATGDIGSQSSVWVMNQPTFTSMFTGIQNSQTMQWVLLQAVIHNLSKLGADTSEENIRYMITFMHEQIVANANRPILAPSTNQALILAYAGFDEEVKAMQDILTNFGVSADKQMAFKGGDNAEMNGELKHGSQGLFESIQSSIGPLAILVDVHSNTSLIKILEESDPDVHANNSILAEELAEAFVERIESGQSLSDVSIIINGCYSCGYIENVYAQIIQKMDVINANRSSQELPALPITLPLSFVSSRSDQVSYVGNIYRSLDQYSPNNQLTLTDVIIAQTAFFDSHAAGIYLPINSNELKKLQDQLTYPTTPQSPAGQLPPNAPILILAARMTDKRAQNPLDGIEMQIEASIWDQIIVSDQELLNQILQMGHDGKNTDILELLTQRPAKLYRDTKWSPVDEWRTIYLVLEEPIQVNGRVITQLRIKGFRPQIDSATKRIKPYRGVGHVRTVIRPTQNGLMIPVPGYIEPDGTMGYGAAQKEFEVMSISSNTTHKTDIPIALGKFTDRDYEFVEFGSLPTGFVIAGMEGDDQRVAKQYLPGNLRPLWVVGNIRTGQTTPLSDVFESNQKFFESLGKTIAGYHIAGLTHYFLHPGNWGIIPAKGNEPAQIILRDLDATLIAQTEIEGTDEYRQIIKSVEQVIDWTRFLMTLTRKENYRYLDFQKRWVPVEGQRELSDEDWTDLASIAEQVLMSYLIRRNPRASWLTRRSIVHSLIGSGSQFKLNMESIRKSFELRGLDPAQSPALKPFFQFLMNSNNSRMADDSDSDDNHPTVIKLFDEPGQISVDDLELIVETMFDPRADGILLFVIQLFYKSIDKFDPSVLTESKKVQIMREAIHLLRTDRNRDTSMNVAMGRLIFKLGKSLPTQALKYESIMGVLGQEWWRWYPLVEPMQIIGASAVDDLWSGMTSPVKSQVLLYLFKKLIVKAQPNSIESEQKETEYQNTIARYVLGMLLTASDSSSQEIRAALALATDTDKVDVIKAFIHTFPHMHPKKRAWLEPILLGALPVKDLARVDLGFRSNIDYEGPVGQKVQGAKNGGRGAYHLLRGEFREIPYTLTRAQHGVLDEPHVLAFFLKGPDIKQLWETFGYKSRVTHALDAFGFVRFYIYRDTLIVSDVQSDMYRDFFKSESINKHINSDSDAEQVVLRAKLEELRKLYRDWHMTLRLGLESYARAHGINRIIGATGKSMEERWSDPIAGLADEEKTINTTIEQWTESLEGIWDSDDLDIGLQVDASPIKSALEAQVQVQNKIREHVKKGGDRGISPALANAIYNQHASNAGYVRQILESPLTFEGNVELDEAWIKDISQKDQAWLNAEPFIKVTQGQSLISNTTDQDMTLINMPGFGFLTDVENWDALIFQILYERHPVRQRQLLGILKQLAHKNPELAKSVFRFWLDIGSQAARDSEVIPGREPTLHNHLVANTNLRFRVMKVLGVLAEVVSDLEFKDMPSIALMAFEDQYTWIAVEALLKRVQISMTPEKYLDLANFYKTAMFRDAAEALQKPDTNKLDVIIFRSQFTFLLHFSQFLEPEFGAALLSDGLALLADLPVSWQDIGFGNIFGDVLSQYPAIADQYWAIFWAKLAKSESPTERLYYLEILKQVVRGVSASVWTQTYESIIEFYLDTKDIKEEKLIQDILVVAMQFSPNLDVRTRPQSWHVFLDQVRQQIELQITTEPMDVVVRKMQWLFDIEAIERPDLIQSEFEELLTQIERNENNDIDSGRDLYLALINKSKAGISIADEVIPRVLSLLKQGSALQTVSALSVVLLNVSAGFSGSDTANIIDQIREIYNDLDTSFIQTTVIKDTLRRAAANIQISPILQSLIELDRQVFTTADNRNVQIRINWTLGMIALFDLDLKRPIERVIFTPHYLDDSFELDEWQWLEDDFVNDRQPLANEHILLNYLGQAIQSTTWPANIPLRLHVSDPDFDANVLTWSLAQPNLNLNETLIELDAIQSLLGQSVMGQFSKTAGFNSSQYANTGDWLVVADPAKRDSEKTAGMAGDESLNLFGQMAKRYLDQNRTSPKMHVLWILAALANMDMDEIRLMNMETFLYKLGDLLQIKAVVLDKDNRRQIMDAYEARFGVAFEDIDALVKNIYTKVTGPKEPDRAAVWQLKTDVGAFRHNMYEALTSTAISLNFSRNSDISATLHKSPYKQELEAYRDGLSEILNSHFGLQPGMEETYIVFNRDMMIQQHMWHKFIGVLMFAQRIAQNLNELDDAFEYLYRLSGPEVIKLELLFAFALGGQEFVEETIHLQRRLHQSLRRHYDGQRETVSLEAIYRLAQNGELLKEFGITPVVDGRAIHWSNYWAKVQADDWESSQREDWGRVKSLALDMISSKEDGQPLPTLVIGGSPDQFEALSIKQALPDSSLAYVMQASRQYALAPQSDSGNPNGDQITYLRVSPELLTRHDFEESRPRVAIVFQSIEHTPIEEVLSTLHHVGENDLEILWVVVPWDSSHAFERRQMMQHLDADVAIAQFGVDYLKGDLDDVDFSQAMNRIQQGLNSFGLEDERAQRFEAAIKLKDADRIDQEINALKIQLSVHLIPKRDAYWERYKPLSSYMSNTFSDPRAIRKSFEDSGFDIQRIERLKNGDDSTLFIVRATKGVEPNRALNENDVVKLEPLTIPDYAAQSDAPSLQMQNQGSQSATEAFSRQFLEGSPLDDHITSIELSSRSRANVLQGTFSTSLGDMNFAVVAQGRDVHQLLSSIVNPALKKHASIELMRLWLKFLKSRGFETVHFTFYRKESGQFLVNLISQWVLPGVDINDYLTEDGLRIALSVLGDEALDKALVKTQDFPKEKWPNHAVLMDSKLLAADKATFIKTRLKELILLVGATAHLQKLLAKPEADLDDMIASLDLEKAVEWSTFISRGNPLYAVSRQVQKDISIVYSESARLALDALRALDDAEVMNGGVRMSREIETDEFPYPMSGTLTALPIGTARPDLNSYDGLFWHRYSRRDLFNDSIKPISGLIEDEIQSKGRIVLADIGPGHQIALMQAKHMFGDNITTLAVDVKDHLDEMQPDYISRIGAKLGMELNQAHRPEFILAPMRSVKFAEPPNIILAIRSLPYEEDPMLGFENLYNQLELDGVFVARYYPDQLQSFDPYKNSETQESDWLFRVLTELGAKELISGVFDPGYVYIRKNSDKKIRINLERDETRRRVHRTHHSRVHGDYKITDAHAELVTIVDSSDSSSKVTQVRPRMTNRLQTYLVDDFATQNFIEGLEDYSDEVVRERYEDELTMFLYELYIQHQAKFTGEYSLPLGSSVLRPKALHDENGEVVLYLMPVGIVHDLSPEQLMARSIFSIKLDEARELVQRHQRDVKALEQKYIQGVAVAYQLELRSAQRDFEHDMLGPISVRSKRSVPKAVYISESTYSTDMNVLDIERQLDLLIPTLMRIHQAAPEVTFYLDKRFAKRSSRVQEILNKFKANDFIHLGDPIETAVIMLGSLEGGVGIHIDINPIQVDEIPMGLASAIYQGIIEATVLVDPDTGLINFDVDDEGAITRLRQRRNQYLKDLIEDNTTYIRLLSGKASKALRQKFLWSIIQKIPLEFALQAMQRTIQQVKTSA